MEIKQGKEKTKLQKVVSLCSLKGQDLKLFLKRETRNMPTSKGLKVELKDISVGLVWVESRIWLCMTFVGETIIKEYIY